MQKALRKQGLFKRMLCVRSNSALGALGNYCFHYVKISIKLREFSKNILETVRERE